MVNLSRQKPQSAAGRKPLSEKKEEIRRFAVPGQRVPACLGRPLASLNGRRSAGPNMAPESFWSIDRQGGPATEEDPTRLFATGFCQPRSMQRPKTSETGHPLVAASPNHFRAVQHG
jgi:hypothetical protein